MENKLASHCDMELVKMAMLRHEETFRQQVHELHRLYRVQKHLMLSSELVSCRRQIRRRRRQQPRRALDVHLRLPADECVVVAPPPSADDGLELTLAIGSSGSGGRGRRRRRDEADESTATATPPLASESDISGESLLTTSSSTDTGGSPPYQIQRAMPAFRLQEATTPVVKQPPPRSPWLVQRVSLEMA
ncbi:hypothetical protein BDA96_01G178600 [Sorghum bicolor]|uniref:Uncharacterized protein n=2 Tax=Sorghum bicolor TaxID=4558 RepID=A0A921RXY7_SORBI|nr:uncharacterized protein LOC8064515 [Sorghum bicolor]EER93832.1 hypothetical protein SORBI_3001G170900 [Sorghum bicolor]KAG0548578.1 hypothetical protein BDA96_01G178600 [Sorghum bicolor]KAG0548579.1 hypothetical protein BDA96_01G178600 [Sorghum bicolor]KXG38047.1 hypothetical protein SORBI_3001G170900 [Sorghum bicolor]|eukprot:XP_002466834.1 uncharacterized protein LOC8064515 [Sorghum bicolor]